MSPEVVVMFRFLLVVALCLTAVPVVANSASEGEEPAIQVSPLVRAHLERSRQLEKAGQSEAAGEELEKVLQLTSRIPSAHYARAELLAKEGKADQALDEYTRAIEAIALTRYLR